MAESSLRNLPWYLVCVRVLLVTFSAPWLSCAVSLLLGILGVVLAAKIRGGHPNMTLAYRDVALPIAAMVGAIVLISSAVMEIRHYRQAKALGRIADQMHPAR